MIWQAINVATVVVSARLNCHLVSAVVSSVQLKALYKLTCDLQWAE